MVILKHRCYWYAIRTKSRQEKIVEKLLREKKVEVYLPLREEVHQWSDRKKKVAVPLFPGYLFTYCLASDLARVYYTKGVAHIVGGLSGETPVPELQIASIKTLLASNIPFAAHPYFEKGREVRVKRGPLKGCYGKIVHKKGKTRLVVAIDLIARAVSAEVSMYDVEAL